MASSGIMQTLKNLHKTPDNRLSRLARFYVYGLHGFAMEICFTAIWELVANGNPHLHGVTSVYAFFIYGISAVVIELLHSALIGKTSLIVRGLIYMMWNYVWEFSTGFILKQFNACPWDYEPYFQGHFMGLIALEYAPLWYACGLFAELFVIDFTQRIRWAPSSSWENSKKK